MKHIKSTILGILSAVFIAACGGGGGGGGDGVTLAPGVSITPANAEVIAAAVLDSVDAVEGTSGGATFITGAVVNTADGSFNYADFFTRQLRQLSGFQIPVTGSSIVGVVIPQTSEPCTDGGSITVSGNVTDPNLLAFSVGDSISVSFSACNELGIVLNGGFSLVITQAIPAVFDGSTPFTLGLDVTLSSFSVNEAGSLVTGNGDISITTEDDGTGNFGLLLSGSSLTSTVDGVASTLTNYLYDLSGNDITGDYSLDLNGTIDTAAIGGTVSFTTVIPFTGNDFGPTEDPTVGELLVTTSVDNSQATLIALSDGINVQILVDEDGNDIFETTIMTTWAAL